jgi:hypothetical protein
MWRASTSYGNVSAQSRRVPRADAGPAPTRTTRDGGPHNRAYLGVTRTAVTTPRRLISTVTHPLVEGSGVVVAGGSGVNHADLGPSEPNAFPMLP